MLKSLISKQDYKSHSLEEKKQAKEFNSLEAISTMVVNRNYWYGGNDIIKIWENFLKKELDGELCYRTESGNRASLFGEGSQEIQMAQQSEFAIIFKDKNLYKNHLGKSITISGEVTKRQLQSRIKDVLRQIKNYNDSVEEGLKITNHQVIAPYNSGGHWLLIKLDITISGKKVIIEQYDPYGIGKRIEFNFNIRNPIEEIEVPEKIDGRLDWNKKQQHDSTSCGAITAENGKQFLQSTNVSNYLNNDYRHGAKQLRIQHIQEINNEIFNKRQREDAFYNAQGDISFGNQQKNLIFQEFDNVILGSKD